MGQIGEFIAGGFDNVITAFNAIISFFVKIFNIIEGIFTGIYKFYNLLDSIWQYVLRMTSYFPSWISQFILLSLAISIVMLIVGRQGGQSR